MQPIPPSTFFNPIYQILVYKHERQPRHELGRCSCPRTLSISRRSVSLPLAPSLTISTLDLLTNHQFNSRAPPVDTIIPNESATTTSLVDVDSGVSLVPPDFQEQSVKTETQAARIESEAEAARAAEEKERNQQNGSSKDSKKAQVKKQAKRAEDYAHRHPVQLVNSILGTVAAVALGVGAYRKYKVGELSWKVVGIWGGAAAAIAAVDILATR